MLGPDSVATMPVVAEPVNVACVMLAEGSLPRLTSTGSVALPVGPVNTACVSVTAGFSVPP